jgi:hypothetical protein
MISVSQYTYNHPVSSWDDKYMYTLQAIQRRKIARQLTHDLEMSNTYGQVADSKQRRGTRVCMQSLHIPHLVHAAFLYSSPLLWSLPSGSKL